jgi:tRNA pseudouridine55 synthase
MGHGGTLDPLASGILIIGIGRGTKVLSHFLGGTKTYEVVVLFGKSTESFDVSGAVTGEMGTQCVTREVVEKHLDAFRGVFRQVPPVYSALRINGVKACEYVRAGKELPKELEAREVCVEDCELLQFVEAGTHEYWWQNTDTTPAPAPAARIKLTVSSGFYVRSFCHELGMRCGSLATMAALVRTRQSSYTLSDPPETPYLSTAITYEELEAGEEVWGPKVREKLRAWMDANPVIMVKMNGHGRKNGDVDNVNSDQTTEGVRQRFRGEWLASTKKERIKQQGGKWKGKYNQPTSKKVKEAGTTFVES